jgi:hypothetical protein
MNQIPHQTQIMTALDRLNDRFDEFQAVILLHIRDDKTGINHISDADLWHCLAYNDRARMRELMETRNKGA